MAKLIEDLLGRKSGELHALAGTVRIVSSEGTGGLPQGVEPPAEHLLKLANQVALLQSTATTQNARILENTRALGQNTASRGTTALGEVGRAAAGMSGAGLFLSPLVTGLLRIFGGGRRNEAPPALVSYIKPESIAATVGLTRGDRASAVSYGQSGMARTLPAPTAITVQVNAIDSRSFLDHRDDIARAVRSALLESHALGDVIREL